MGTTPTERTDNENRSPAQGRVTYTHWTDKRTHKTVTEYALIRGSWIYTQSGLRKRADGTNIRADGTNIRVDETYKRAPRGTAHIFQEIENIEHHGVLVDRDGTICGYTESAPSVDELGRVTWDSYTLTPETYTAAGTYPTRRVSVGRGYWFSHPNLADGKTLAHVTFPEVGLGSARDEQGRIKR